MKLTIERLSSGTAQEKPSEDARKDASRELAVRSIASRSDFGDGLNQRALAQRFELDKTGIARWKTSPAGLAEYTRNRDPDRIAWEFRDGKFFPLAD